jgi:glycosyltransferase involved in cell wall biosynthesis
LAARFAGGPGIVHTPHGHVFYGYFGPFTTRAFILAERIAALVTDRIVTLTDAGRKDHLHFGIGAPEKYRVIPSGIDIGRFEGKDGSGVRAEIGCGTGPVVGWAGRLVTVKDCGTFLRAMALVLAKRPDAYVVIAGDGEEHDALVLLAEELGISARVRFLGDRRDMPHVLASFDVFVLSSVNEGFGRVIIEAMAAGAPVVSTAVGGTPEVIDDGVTGLLVPPGDPGKMAEAVLRVLGEPGLAERLRDRARLGMVRFTTRFMVDAYEEIYRDLLGRRDAFGNRSGAGGR